jgi:hypothetical protein
MNKHTLIANSGIQFINYGEGDSGGIVIDANHDVITPISFYEAWVDERIRLEFATYLSDYDKFVTTRSLFEAGYLDQDGKLYPGAKVNINVLNCLKLDENCYTVSNIELCLEKYLNMWLPMPLFELSNNGKSKFGPANWCRMYIKEAKEKSPETKSKKKYIITFAIDTKTDYVTQSADRPFLNRGEASKKYSICNDRNQTLNFLSASHGCQWVDQYLKDYSHELQFRNPDDHFTMKYLAYYIYLVQYMHGMGLLDDVTLFTDDVIEKAEVDLVLDIGNSKTCGLLFDKVEPNKTFTKVKRLKLHDLSNPEFAYDDSFDMRLAFYKASFGDINDITGQFIWPSILRLGYEAQKLIYHSKNVSGIESKLTHHSSPKRYLWDDSESDKPWEFICLDENSPSRDIFIEGISDQFGSDGTFGEKAGLSTNFSRKSLMTFVFLEILTHALVQINSHEFREFHGDISKPRKIKKILITCPTAMAKQEQIALRQMAEDANRALLNFLKRGNETIYSQGQVSAPEIIPSVKDLSVRIENIEVRKDWGYDEATSCQLLYIYSEISQRYLNKSDEYFSIYGRPHANSKFPDENTITIGSVDIGAGTTDIMICNYSNDFQGKAILTPEPLFWESFYYAGDDLLENIIKQVIIEGDKDANKHRGTNGMIYQKLIENGNSHSEATALLNNFFGVDSNNQSDRARKRRANFNVQVSVPLALLLLEKTQKRDRDDALAFDNIFPLLKPQKDLLDSFAEHFNFRFESIVWKFSKDNINDIVERTFDPLIRKISAILYAYGCDFVLLAGRPTGLHRIGELFKKYYAVPPDRLITLNDYRVGRWYPFADDRGYFKDQKSIVAVGAMIGMMGGVEDKLEGFKLNIKRLKEKVLPTSDYIGAIDMHTKNIKNPFLGPEHNRESVAVSGLPVYIGCQQFDSGAYPARLLYVLDYDKAGMLKYIMEEEASDFLEALDIYEKRVRNISNVVPLKFSFSRDYRQNREELVIQSIEDKDRNQLGRRYFKLRLQTLNTQSDFWLDSGGFILTI